MSRDMVDEALSTSDAGSWVGSLGIRQRMEMCERQRDENLESVEHWRNLTLKHCDTISFLSKRVRELEKKLLDARLGKDHPRVNTETPFAEHWREE